MRKRLRKKSELKRIKAAKKLFNLRKSLAISQLITNTYRAYSKLIGQPVGTREVMAYSIYDNYKRQSFAIRSTIFRDDKETDMRKRLRKKKDKQEVIKIVSNGVLDDCINPVDVILDIVTKVANNQGIEVDTESFERAKEYIKQPIMKCNLTRPTYINVA